MNVIKAHFSKEYRAKITAFKHIEKQYKDDNMEGIDGMNEVLQFCSPVVQSVMGLKAQETAVQRLVKINFNTLFKQSNTLI
ncbi:hypothetical protein NC652_035589 [Populus alba x Populus x berolinensis]|nr:hypothetical protein NC652_035589 [Populus alba x Populus x berolinensis]